RRHHTKRRQGSHQMPRGSSRASSASSAWFHLSCIYHGPAEGLHQLMLALEAAQALNVEIRPIPPGAIPAHLANGGIAKRARNGATEHKDDERGSGNGNGTRAARPRYSGKTSRQIVLGMLKKGPVEAKDISAKLARMGRSPKSAHPLLYVMANEGAIVRVGGVGEPVYAMPGVTRSAAKRRTVKRSTPKAKAKAKAKPKRAAKPTRPAAEPAPAAAAAEERAMATNGKAKAVRTLRVYRSYNFIDKDPIIDELRTIVHGIRYSEIHELSGVSTHALYGWFHGQTRRPQFATVMAVTRSLGYD